MKLPAWLWPIRTGKTFFDVWSICHFVAGMLIGYNVGAFTSSFAIFAAINLVIGFGWEGVERVLEKKGMVKHPEVWFNSFISDPIMVFLGGCLGFYLVSLQ